MVRGRSLFVLFVTLFFVFIPSTKSLYISGSRKEFPSHGKPKWSVHSEYLAKFGANKGSSFYVYGNAEHNSDRSSLRQFSQWLLVVAPENKWNDFTQLAESSLNEINTYACNSTLLQPFLTNESSCMSHQYYRVVPCNNTNCMDSNQSTYPQYSNFIFRITPDKTQFYFVFFIDCARNWSMPDVPSCDWDSSGSVDFTYNVSITDDPFIKRNPFTFQFPDDMEGVLVSYLIFFFLYIILVPIHLLLNFKFCAKKRCQVPVLVWLFTLAMVMEGINIFLGLIHYSVYSHNGKGVLTFFYLKEFFNLIGDWFLILVLILIAGGWQVTVKRVTWRYASFPIWFLYIFFALLYYIMEVVFLETKPWKLGDPLQTWAGGLYLAVRGIILFYVWYQIYHIYRQEEAGPKLNLYKLLFVVFTVWFWYLPLLVIIVTFTGHVTASLVIINISTAMNFLVNLIMVLLFCPKWSKAYFQFDSSTNNSPWLLETYTKLSVM